MQQRPVGPPLVPSESLAHDQARQSFIQAVGQGVNERRDHAADLNTARLMKGAAYFFIGPAGPPGPYTCRVRAWTGKLTLHLMARSRNCLSIQQEGESDRNGQLEWLNKGGRGADARSDATHRWLVIARVPSEQPGAAVMSVEASGGQYMRYRTTRAESTVSPPTAASAAPKPKASASTPVSSAPMA